MFSPRTPAARSHTSFNSSLRGTPTKRGLSTPRQHARDKSFRTMSGAGNRTALSQIVDESSTHRVESFGVPLPVLITEALTLADRTTETSVKIDPSGWAWLVGGRKLFVWRYKPTTARGVLCKELTLPPSDLAHSAARVCVLARDEGQPTACVAVSPEGVVRYWPNIAYEASTAEISAELKGEECACVVNFQPFGCLLATTTSSLLLLKPSCGQSSIVCTALKTSQGMFSGISRRMSSFIFGASTAQTSGAPLQALVAEEEEESQRLFYVLTDTHLQHWQLSSFASEKMLYQVDVLRLFKDALAREVWDQDSINLPQLHVWVLDLQLFRNGVIILGAGVNLENSPELYYAVALLKTTADELPSEVHCLQRLSHTDRYEESREEELLNYHLLVPSRKSSEALVYSSRVIFTIAINDGHGDRLDLQSASDQLIGAGTYDEEATCLFFSSSHGLFCLRQNPEDQISIQDMGSESLLRSEQSTLGFNMTQFEELSHSEKKLSRLKACFIASMSGHQKEVEGMLADLFPALLMEDDACSQELDHLVTELSCELIDDFPAADPRWAESCGNDGGGSTRSLIIVQQLKDKVRAHDYFVAFLKKYRLWDKLSVVKVNGGSMCTSHVLCEHVEKLEAAIKLREQDVGPSQVVNICIRKLILDLRGKDVPKALHPEDVYYREVSRMDDISGVFLDYELEQLGASGVSARHCSQLISTVNSLLRCMVLAALEYRQAKQEMYQFVKENVKSMPEYVPWTSSSGERGLRTILNMQVSLTVERGIAETQDVGLRGVLFEQLMVLADLLLDGYSSQLESLRDRPQHTDRYNQLAQQYHHHRRQLIETLLQHEQYDRAASLAEKYLDFDILIAICDATDNQARLQRYVQQFSQQRFSQHLLNWYLKEGKRGRLLTQQFAPTVELDGFLNTDNNRYLSWLHHIGAGKFIQAHQALTELARSEKTFLTKRKTLLSLSKLAALAGSTCPGDVDQSVAAINEELSQVELQEAIPTDVLHKLGLDPDNMVVLSPQELIKLYAGDKNENASETDFKSALDLLLYIDPNEQHAEYEEHRLFIWCQALLRDRHRWLTPSENDPMKMRNESMFFRTVDLLYNEGEDLTQLLPSPEALLQCPLLTELRGDPNFHHLQYLLKACYEVIDNLMSA